MTEVYVVLAFSTPPLDFRFTRARSGKCWVRTIEGKQWALKLGSELSARGIHGIIKRKRVTQKTSPRPDAHKTGRQGPSPYRYPYPEALREAARLDGR